MAKDKNNIPEVMAGLMGTLPPIEEELPSTPANEELPVEEKPAKPSKKATKATIATAIDGALMEKLRGISLKEGVTLKDIYELAFSRFIQAYEEKHGPIKPRKPRKKGSISDLL
ncbi:MAG: hypothetical protein LIP09_12235 [Bacteroidales bacterium]|nr:hypothetical protein [Bacteroidales bacterium]